MRALLPKNPIAMLSREKILLGCILILAFILRLYRINNPVGDWHAFRQADTASVTREYVKAPSIDLLRPQYHDLGNIQSGLDNLDGYRMVEFPLVNAVLAWILRNVPSLDLVITSCTSICHLAGALGKPVWIVLPWAADWRWLIEREDSPWCPNARLFRQTKAGDWHEVFQRVETELKQAIAANQKRD